MGLALAMACSQPGMVATGTNAELAKVKGNLLVGVINSMAHRKDAKALSALAKFLQDADSEVAQAANAAMARIRPAM